MNRHDLLPGLSTVDEANSVVADRAAPKIGLPSRGRTTTVISGWDISDPTLLMDRRARVRLLVVSVLGLALLNLALKLQPAGGSPFAPPPDAAAWMGAICGVVGFWLIPGVWVSALVTQPGAGLSSWLATRIGTTLAWYALVGPLMHQLGQGAQVTTGLLFLTTGAATVATCFGVALGLVRRPADPWRRMLIVALAAAACTQATISLTMLLWTYDMNYDHIRRLDWLIVLACTSLAVAGERVRPTLPAPTAGYVRQCGCAWAVLVASAAVVVMVGSLWSPEQRMPSALSIEQVPAPAGADVALSATALGPDGPQMLSHAVFVGSDATGKPVPVRTRLAEQNGTPDRATVLVALDPASRPSLCGRRGATGPATPAKITLREEQSGVLVQALIPDGWCAP